VLATAEKSGRARVWPIEPPAGCTPTRTHWPNLWMVSAPPCGQYRRRRRTPTSLPVAPDQPLHAEVCPDSRTGSGSEPPRRRYFLPVALPSKPCSSPITGRIHSRISACHSRSFCHRNSDIAVVSLVDQKSETAATCWQFSLAQDLAAIVRTSHRNARLAVHPAWTKPDIVDPHRVRIAGRAGRGDGLSTTTPSDLSGRMF